ncbi:MAG TPA: PHP domain-containing protein [Candidatus Limnocylindrales bacterium]|nr:PHP domain-containing protein [Candidatus Limnocylindrales bacterium]
MADAAAEAVAEVEAVPVAVAGAEALAGSEAVAGAETDARAEALARAGADPDRRSFLDLHCHSCYSFDSISRPADIVRAAASRGLTHLAITDHDVIEGALRALDLAPVGLTVIVGEEILTREGDCLGLFLERAVPPGLSLAETIAAIHEQGGLAGLPHPFDQLRRSSGLARGREELLAPVLPQLDFIEAFNARVVNPSANERAAELAVRHGLPGVASSDAHHVSEVAVACTIVPGPAGTPAGLKDALSGGTLLTGRASYYLRGLTWAVKIAKRARGVRRIPPATSIE